MQPELDFNDKFIINTTLYVTDTGRGFYNTNTALRVHVASTRLMAYIPIRYAFPILNLKSDDTDTIY